MKDFKKLAKKIEDALLADITDRRGWRQEWDHFDDDIKKEIYQTHTEIIRKVLEEALSDEETDTDEP